LWDLRIAKLRSSVDLFIKEGRVQASLNHLTPMEINSVRPVFPDTLDALMILHEVRYIFLYFTFSYKLNYIINNDVLKMF
jgi:GINS complex subunit 2